MIKLNLFIFLICLTVSNDVKSQKVRITNKYFENTIWFSNNSDSLFFYSDTIKLISINLKNEPNLTSYFNEQDYIELRMTKRKKEVIQFFHKTKPWTVSKMFKKYNWSFDNKKQVLALIYQKKLFIKFILMDINKINVNSVFVNAQKVNGIELVLKRVK